ncbi:hypothetical protein ABPG77_008271 [Micractinium sp. CCAP 211/92]
MQSASCDCPAFSCLHPLRGSLHAPSCTSNVCCRPSAAARAVPKGALTRFPFCQLSIVLGCTSREALRAQACGDSWRGSRLWQVLRQWRKQRRCWLLPGRFVSPFQPDRQADEEAGHVPAHQHASRMRSSNRTQRPRARRSCGGALCAGALCSDGSSRLHLCGAVIVHPRFRHTLADPPVAADPPRPLDWHDLPCEVVELVAGHLDKAQDLLAFSAVCRATRPLACNNALWKGLCRRQFDVPEEPAGPGEAPPPGFWRDLYRFNYQIFMDMVRHMARNMSGGPGDLARFGNGPMVIQLG